MKITLTKNRKLVLPYSTFEKNGGEIRVYAGSGEDGGGEFYGKGGCASTASFAIKKGLSINTITVEVKFTDLQPGENTPPISATGQLLYPKVNGGKGGKSVTAYIWYDDGRKYILRADGGCGGGASGQECHEESFKFDYRTTGGKGGSSGRMESLPVPFLNLNGSDGTGTGGYMGPAMVQIEAL